MALALASAAGVGCGDGEAARGDGSSSAGPLLTTGGASAATSDSEDQSDSTAAARTTTGPTTRAATTSGGLASSTTDDGPPMLPPAVDPGPPAFPDTIDTLSVAVRTADVDNAGTDENVLSICLTDGVCRVLNIPDVDDFRRGEIDVYHFPDLGLPRAEVDRIELRSADGPNAWRPSCLEVRFDGEPVYCEDTIDVWLGTDDTDVTSWEDPLGLHRACETCYDSSLTHGSMRGAPAGDTARIWVRTDATRAVGLRMGPTPDLTDAPVVAWAYPRPDDDFTATLEVPNLPEGLDWFYDVQIDGQPLGLERDPVRAAPPAGSEGPVRFAFGSCARDEQQPIFAVIDQLDPAFFLFVGDNHYADSNQLDTVRWHYRRSRRHAPRSRFVQDTPTLATWDDHDFVGNNTNGEDPLKSNSLQAFSEYWSNGTYGTEETPGVFGRHRYGDVEFFMLDDRYHRDVEPGSMLGTAQKAWLVDALLDSDATFKFLVSGSVWTELGSTDSWAAYLTERDELFAAIDEENIGGVVLLSGDIHRSVVRWITPTQGAPLLELTSSPLATAPGSCDNARGWEFCYEGNSFLEVEVDTSLEDPTLVGRVYDAAGVELYRIETSRSLLAG